MAENRAQDEERAIIFKLVIWTFLFLSYLDFSIPFLFGLFYTFSTKKIVDGKILEKEG